MPNDPVVWIVAILVLGLVVLVALVLGGKVEVGLDPLRLSFRRKQDAKQERVSVLDEADLEGVEAGNVTGVDRGAGSEDEGRVTDISVVRGARIRNGKLGDVTGLKVGAGDKRPPDKPKDGADSGG